MWYNRIMRISFSRKLQGISFIVLALTVGAVAFSRIHGSSLTATAIRLTDRVHAFGEPKPYEAHVFIPISFDKQDHALSCEVATLKMVLEYKGVAVDESELIAHVGVTDMWGDPSEAFVGNIDGRMFGDGYGVYWQPIARVGNLYRESRHFEGWKSGDLIRTLQEGHPIVVWGCLGRCENRSWTTPDGQEVTGVSYEHTFVVNGFSGTPDDIEGYWLIDPIYGRKYMELDTFMNMWGKLGYSGVVVY